jgi:hypothetical protein
MGPMPKNVQDPQIEHITWACENAKAPLSLASGVLSSPEIE